MRHFAGDAVSAIKGQRLDVPVFSPVVGSDWRYQLAGGFYYRVLMATWTLTTSAAVAKRFPALVVLDGDGNVRLLTVDTGEVPAASVATISAARSLTTAASSSGLAFTIEAPDLIIDPGWQIGSSTTNLQAGDAITGVRLLVEQMIEDNPGEGAGLVRQPTLEIDLEAPHA